VRAIVALVLSALVVGCSGGDGAATEELSKDEYTERVNAITDEMSVAFGRLERESRDVESFEELAALVEEAQANVEDGADELAAIEPPDDIASEHARLADGMEQFARDLDPIVAALESGDSAQAIELAEQLSALDFDSLRQVRAAADGMREKGYEVTVGSAVEPAPS
jgi:hypothetical protein